jgi:hypothetical protein
MFHGTFSRGLNYVMHDRGFIHWAKQRDLLGNPRFTKCGFDGSEVDCCRKYVDNHFVNKEPFFLHINSKNVD